MELAATLARKGDRIQLVPLPPQSTPVQVFQRRFPGVSAPGVIPKEVYGTRNDTPTLSFWNFFICPASLPEEAAYALTKATFENPRPCARRCPPPGTPPWRTPSASWAGPSPTTRGRSATSARRAP